MNNENTTKPKMRKRKKVLIALTAVFSLLIGSIAFIGHANFNFSDEELSDTTYENAMSDSINIVTNPRVVDIAMLGAHDAFTHNIDSFNRVEPDSLVKGDWMKYLGGGLVTRISRAQAHGAGDMLRHGVRYFDIRIALVESEWYTVHGLVSDTLRSYIEETLEFLDSVSGELVILDIHHAKVGNKTRDDLYDYLDTIKINSKSIFDYVSYDTNSISLGNLRYNDVVSGSSGVVIIDSKTLSHSHSNKIYQYTNGDSNDLSIAVSGTVRSVWHDDNREIKMFEKIEKEQEFLSANYDSYKHMMRINQGQMTLATANGSIPNILFKWSLIDCAKSFNSTSVERPDFSNWLQNTPIYMVDFATSNHRQFNDKAMAIINQFNADLA